MITEEHHGLQKACFKADGRSTVCAGSIDLARQGGGVEDQAGEFSQVLDDCDKVIVLGPRSAGLYCNKALASCFSETISMRSEPDS